MMMRKSMWLVSAGLFALSTPAFAQSTDATEAGTAPAPTDGATAQTGAVDKSAASDQAPTKEGDIIITATRRNEALSDVPLAVSAVTGQTLGNSGAVDIRGLNQVSPSLLVSSTSSEAGAGGARIRGIGTVGDNAGLESSVAVFIDGVYRSRIGVGLTELGAIDRIEVLRGPQGTLFGRNASAGLISVITAKPKFKQEVTGQVDIGNYNLRRAQASVNAPLSSTIAARIDGVYMKRDGFLRDVISGRDVNNRNRWLVRGQLLFQPNSDLSVRIIGDYSKRNEECCGAVYLPTFNTVGDASGGFTRTPSSIAALERGMGAIINDDPYQRNISITPGRDYNSDVKDGGASAELVYKLGAAELTSITAYRYNNFVRGHDADYNNLDLLYRDGGGGAGNRFKTFTQELRLQGSLFGDHLDWLVGGFYANEKLRAKDNLSTGADLDRYARGLISANPGLGAFPGFNLLNPFVRAVVASRIGGSSSPGQQAIINAIGSQVVNTPLSNETTRDVFNQHDVNYALFTHNIFKVTDKLSLTLGARYTRDRKTLDASLFSTSQCAAYTGNIVRLRTLAATTTNATIRALANGIAGNLTTLGQLPCALNSINGNYSGGRKSESKWSGTAVASYKLTPEALFYLSYSKGYKAGGFNLDRAGLTFGNVNLNALQFAPELVDSYEAGMKFNGHGIDINVAVFKQEFKNFQLNTFNGINFVVENVNSCSTSLNGADTDASAAPVACGGKRKAGVSVFGVESEFFFKPSTDTTASLGATYVDTHYQRNLIGAANNALIPALFQLPGRPLSNAPQFTATASFGWTPPIGDSGMKGLIYVDARHSSGFNTGSDLDIEKYQTGFNVVNARIGLTGPQRHWGVELWAQNLFKTNYKQVAFDSPLQGSCTTRGAQRGSCAATLPAGYRATQLYSAFLGEPRTYGLTVKGRF